MDLLVNKKIPNEYEVICVVNKGKDNTLFTDELIELLFSTMKSKWIPLSAFKRVVTEDDHEESLYIAYNPKIINRSLVGGIINEIRNFFSAISTGIEIDSGSAVRIKTRNNYYEVKNIDSKETNVTYWRFPVSPFYKPYLLSLGKTVEEVEKELATLSSLMSYKWYRIKKEYIGNASMTHNIDKFTDEFVCINKDDNLNSAIEAYKTYDTFRTKNKAKFEREYKLQQKREALNRKLLNNEISVIDSTIDISDFDEFLNWNPIYYTKGSLKFLKELYENGWNEQHYNGYKEENMFFIFEEDMQQFSSNHWKVKSWNLGSYLSAMEKYLQFRWERENLPTSNNETPSLSGKESNAAEKELESDNEELSPDKKIRIDIMMDDIDEFLDFLEKREPNRQIRKRYIDVIKVLYKNGWNECKHNTFIDNNTYKVNTNDIEIFINGLKTRDFNIKLKDYEESLGLYLSYRWEKQYEKPKPTEKEDAVSPIIVVKKKPDGVDSDKKEVKDGKKIYVNIAHMDEYKSSKSESRIEKIQPSVLYVGDPDGEHKSKTMQVSSISEDEESVTVNINFNDRGRIETKPNINISEKDPEPEELISATAQKPKEDTSIWKIAKVLLWNFGDLVKMIIRCVFGNK